MTEQKSPTITLDDKEYLINDMTQEQQALLGVIQHAATTIGLIESGQKNVISQLKELLESNDNSETAD